ncbi:MAG TPA: hypothetical protein VMJ10_28725 [Kofleriaceae bacterium]|nr:hypothetical protein [Kofleriaceae bacterium]
MEAPARKTPKFWMAVQPSIIRIYKVAGLFTLTAILLGLIGFLVVNIFYFFDHTWVRPVVLSPTHQKVIEAQQQLDNAELNASKLDAEKLEIAASLDEIKRAVDADNAFLTEVGKQADDPKTPEQWLVHREVEKARLDLANETGRRAPLEARQKSIELTIKDQKQLVDKLAQSPYLRAINGKVVLGFVPYQNLRSIKEGETKLYACSWGLVLCHVVGKVKTTIEGEVQDIHPHDESVQRGIMVELDLSTPSAEGETVLFAGGKPLWLF